MKCTASLLILSCTGFTPGASCTSESVDQKHWICRVLHHEHWMHRASPSACVRYVAVQGHGLDVTPAGYASVVFLF